MDAHHKAGAVPLSLSKKGGQAKRRRGCPIGRGGSTATNLRRGAARRARKKNVLLRIHWVGEGKKGNFEEGELIVSKS